MKTIVRCLLAVTALGCLAVLGLSVWPGVVYHVFLVFLIVGMLLGFVLVPVGIGAVVVGLIWIRRRQRAGRQVRLPDVAALPLWSTFAIPATCVATMVVLVAGVPIRLVFAAYRSEFEQLAGSALAELHGTGEVRDRNIGPYSIHDYAVDPRGGVYLRTFSAGDGFFPIDSLSHGFALSPNAEGTPFGAAKYRKTKLVGDWYVFSASDDWY